MGQFRVATVNMHVEPSKDDNVEKVLGYIEEAAKSRADLLVLPELAFEGYLWGRSGLDEFNLSSDQLKYFMEVAETIPGPTTEKIESYAKRLDIDVVFGMAEKSGASAISVLYNSAVYISPMGIKGVFRKIHLPGDEMHLFNSGNLLPVFKSKVGELGILICWDIAYPEVSRVLALKGAEILCFPTAWPMEGQDPESDFWGETYDLWTRVRAMENQSWLLASNQVGKCSRSGWEYYGHSRIIAPDGRTVKEITNQEGMIFEDVDVQGEILKTRTSFLDIGNLFKDRKPTAYKLIADESLYNPPNELNRE
jgi:predicted amidohydrolase